MIKYSRETISDNAKFGTFMWMKTDTVLMGD
jgi:hypothetical protein